MIEKNGLYETEISGISALGSGVGRIDGMSVFVPYTAAGDKLTVRIDEVKKNYAFAHAVEFSELSPDRCSPECGAYMKCGGCQLMHINYDAQLAAKRSVTENALRRIGGLRDFSLEEMIGSKNRFHYRNKAVFHAGSVNGEPEFGFYAQKSHDIIPAEGCLLCGDFNRAVIRAVKEYMRENNVAPFDEKTGRGSVRSIFTRASAENGNAVVVLSVNAGALLNEGRLTEKLRDAYPLISGIVLNIQKKRGKEIFRTIFGSNVLTEDIFGLEFSVSPQSFFQVNPQVMRELYGTVLEYADLNKSKTVLDLYCGIGTISLCAAKNARYVTGVEAVERAVKDAEANAERNGVKNARFFAARTEDIVPKLFGGGERPDVVILDPPRKGCDKAAIEAITRAAPERVVYVSCDPATLARDARVFAERGYLPERARGFDMFPQTCHVETVCQLALRRSPVHINIDVNVEELVRDKRGQATYEQIKEYVLEHSGLKVSSLYIAQVKRKCGIIECENYNKPKSEDTKQLICPPEKETAIKEALKHFGMIE